MKESWQFNLRIYQGGTSHAANLGSRRKILLVAGEEAVESKIKLSQVASERAPRQFLLNIYNAKRRKICNKIKRDMCAPE